LEVYLRSEQPFILVLQTPYMEKNLHNIAYFIHVLKTQRQTLELQNSHQFMHEKIMEIYTARFQFWNF
jgi:hypothetical protein